MSLSDDDDDVSEFIRQFLEDITPALQDADSLDAIEDKLSHLEETDEEFHKYPYIKHLRRRIDTALTGLIDDEIDQNKSHDVDSGNEETLVNRITGRLLKSSAYLNLLKSLKVETKAAVDSLIRSFQDDLIQRARKENTRQFEGGGRRSPKQSALSFTDDSSLGSSFNQGAFAFVSQEQFIEMVQNLDVSKPISVRRSALNSLYQMPPSEAQACEYWNVLRHTLGDGLADSDEELSEKCLKYYARMLAAPHPILTSDIYGSLVEHIASYFGARKGMVVPVDEGIDLTDPSVIKLIRRFSLMCQFQLEVSTYWVRYPDRFMDNIIESTLSLLAVNPSIPLSNTENITPLHYVALIDTKGNWFKKWMHGNYSRSVVLCQLKKHRFLIENTVRWCLRLREYRNRKLDPLDDVTGNIKWTNITSSKHQYYTKSHIEYCYMVHSLCIIGRLLLYKGGRFFFPIKLKELPDPVSVTSFLVSVINLVVYPIASPTNTSNLHSKIAGYDSSILVTEMLKKLTESDSSCSECLCRDAVTDALLKPVRTLLSSAESDSMYVSHKSSEMTLLHVADVLSSLAAVKSGRSQLLYGEGRTSFTINPSAPIHTIAKFAVKCLSGGTRFEPTLPNSVITAFVYICRQLYSTCEGLFVLKSYHLHTSIANAWEEATRAADLASTPTPRSDYGASGDSTDEESALILADNLLDNLLNIAATPKGLLLMQLSGGMSECVAYMYSRYKKKLQVSKCEKFGYGVMLTQVAATSPGIEALYNTGFVKTLIHDAWSTIECDPEDHKISLPTPYPVDPVDKAAHKPLTSLLKMLSSYQALYQIISDVPLCQQQSSTFRDVPKTVTELIEKLVMLNLERGHYLFNLEQSHVFGLRFLNVLCSCLDSMLLLESQYNIRDCLLQCQESNTTENTDVVIVDMCSIERNHILARVSSIGGASERVLPPRALSEGPNPYPWPMITSLLLPKEYTVTIGNKSSIKQGSDLSKFLSSTKSWDHDVQWIEGCKKAFIQSLKNKPDVTKTAGDLLERVLKAHINVGSEVVFPLLNENEENTQSPSLLTETQKLGIQMVVKYGSQLKLFKPGNDTETNLVELLKSSTGMLSKQQRKIPSTLKHFESSYPGMDWFIATIFLIYCGNRERVWKFILKFSSIIHSAYMWMPRLHNSEHLPVNLSMSGIHPLFSSIGHYIEMILHCEVPLVSSAFRLSGYTPSQICQHWLRQCFWNYLNWSDICHYVCMCLTMGIDYQVYMCVAVLKHQQRNILYKSQLQDLIFFLMEEPIVEFRMGDHVEFMQHLETKYRPVILSDIRDLSTP